MESKLLIIIDKLKLIEERLLKIENVLTQTQTQTQTQINLKDEDEIIFIKSKQPSSFGSGFHDPEPY